MPTESTARVSKAVLALAGVVVVVAGLKLAQPLLAPLLLAALMTAMFAPIASWLSARGLPAGVSAVVALLAGVASIAGCGFLVAHSANAARAQLPAYWQSAQHGADSLAMLLNRFGFHASRASILSFLDADRLIALVGTTLGAAADILPDVVLLPLIVFFALAEVAGFGDKLRSILPDTSKSLERIDSSVREVQKYLLVKTGTSLIAAIAVGAWLFAWRVDFALLLAFITFLLHFIPNIGMIIALVPAVAVALLQHGPGTASAVAIGYVIISGIVGNVIEPKVMGRTLGLSPLVVLLAMMFWDWVWGPIGALLSVPLLMIAKIAAEATDDFRWIAILIGPSVEEHPTSKRRASLIPAVLRPLIPAPLVRRGVPVGLGAGPRPADRAAPTAASPAGPPPSPGPVSARSEPPGG